jgi:hypothetical protein
MCFRREFFHIAGKVVLQRIKPPTDITTLFFSKSSQLLTGFFFNFKTLAHRSFEAIDSKQNGSPSRGYSASRALLFVHDLDLLVDYLAGETVNRHMHPVTLLTFDDMQHLGITNLARHAA